MVLAAASILLAMITLRAELGEKPRPQYIPWYFDTVTQQYFEGPPTALAPIKSPAGNEAVRVTFYRCAECDETQPLLHMYEKYEAGALTAYEQLLSAGEASDDEISEASELLEEHKLVSFDGVNWTLYYDMDDPEETLGRQCAQGELIYVPDPR